MHYIAMQRTIQSIIIWHLLDIPISGSISLRLFSLLHNLIVVPSLCRGDNSSLYVRKNSITQRRAAQIAEVRIWNRSVYYSQCIGGVYYWEYETKCLLILNIFGDYLLLLALRIYESDSLFLIPQYSILQFSKGLVITQNVEQFPWTPQIWLLWCVLHWK